MKQESVRSSILDGIKVRARLLKSQRNLKQHDALDQASIDAGYENFRHAQNVARRTPARIAVLSNHRLFISMHWRSSRDRGAALGRETTWLDLPAPLESFITAAQLSNKRSTRPFKLVAPDHLESPLSAKDQSQARASVCHVARVVQFIVATGLRPANGGWARAFPGLRHNNLLPGKDHSSVWFDPVSKRYVFVDEPYGSGASWTKPDSREAWAAENDFTIAEASWAGMYNPAMGSRLFLVSHNVKGLPLQPILTALANASPALVEDQWVGESVERWSVFVSPGAVERAQRQAAAKAVQKRGRPGPRATVGYVQTFVGPRRRPAARMPLEAHEEIARLLGIVLSATETRKGVSKRVGHVRSDLDEWVQREYTHAELPNERFHDMYYGDRGLPSLSKSMDPAEAAEHRVRLNRVREILKQHYPDCGPLRALFKSLDVAEKSLTRWAATH